MDCGNVNTYLQVVQTSGCALIWLINKTLPTDNKIVWRAYTASDRKLDPVLEKVYTRVPRVSL